MWSLFPVELLGEIEEQTDEHKILTWMQLRFHADDAKRGNSCENHLWLREYFNRMIQFSFDNVLFLMRVGPMVNGSVKCLMLNVLFSILFIEDLFFHHQLRSLVAAWSRQFCYAISTITSQEQEEATSSMVQPSDSTDPMAASYSFVTKIEDRSKIELLKTSASSSNNEIETVAHRK